MFEQLQDEPETWDPGLGICFIIDLGLLDLTFSNSQKVFVISVKDATSEAASQIETKIINTSVLIVFLILRILNGNDSQELSIFPLSTPKNEQVLHSAVCSKIIIVCYTLQPQGG